MRGIRIVLGAELRQILRDRRALFAAVFLPLLLYPLLLGGSEKLGQAAQERLSEKSLVLRLDSERADPQTVAEVEGLLAGPATTLERGSALALEEALATPLHSLEEQEQERRLAEFRALTRGGEGAVLVLEEEEGRGGPLKARLYSAIKDDSSRELARRVGEILRRWDKQNADQRRLELLAIDPAADLVLTRRDLADEEGKSGRDLGRILPILLVFLLISGGSFGALSVFSGEREAKTLETLLSTPAPRTTLVLGKFLAVFLVGLASLLSNLTGLALAGRLGAKVLPEGGLSLAQLASTLVFLPALVLLLAILCLFCGKARTFRQGQQMLFPLTIVLVLPTLIVLAPGLEHTFLLALLPVSGAALSLRDALGGRIEVLPTLAMLLSHAFWSALVLRRLARSLDAEGMLLGGDVAAEAQRRRLASRHGKRIGFVGVLLMLAVGTRLQAVEPRTGLALTLWAVLLPLAAPGLAYLMEQLMRGQEKLLPLPTGALDLAGLEALFSGTSTPLLLLLFALGPGICEEVLFRGAVLSSLRRDGGIFKALFVSSGFFALAHLSLYRLAPTFSMGVVLGAITWRRGSLLPAIVLHSAYDAYALLAATGRLPEGVPANSAWSLVLALPILALSLRARPKRP